jgi:hypothetical protein
MNWSNNLSKKLRNSYNAMKRLLRGIKIHMYIFEKKVFNFWKRIVISCK